MSDNHAPVKFESTNSVIDAFQAFVVQDDRGFFHPAKTFGGRESRTGLTLENPWIQKGAIRAFRHDVLPGTTEAFEKWLYETFNYVYVAPKEVIVFEGHGTSPTAFSVIEVARYRASLELWNKWRDWTTHQGPRPNCSMEEDYLAKRNSRDHGGILTAGEALEGLAMRTTSICSLSVTYDPATKTLPESWDWEVCAPGVGRARGSSEIEGVRPDYFFFEKVQREEWEWDDGQGGEVWRCGRIFSIKEVEGDLVGRYSWWKGRPLPLKEGETFNRWERFEAETIDIDDTPEWKDATRYI